MASIKEDKKNQTWLIVVLCVIVVLCAILIYFKFFNSEKIAEAPAGDLLKNKIILEDSGKNAIDEEIDIESLANLKLESFYEAPSNPVDYKVGNKKPFEPFE